MNKTISKVFVPVYKHGNINEIVSKFVFTDFGQCQRYISSIPNPMYVNIEEFAIVHDPSEEVRYNESYTNHSMLVGFNQIATQMLKSAENAKTRDEFFLNMWKSFHDMLLCYDRCGDNLLDSVNSGGNI